MRDIGATARTLSGEDRTPPPRLRAWPWIPACAGLTGFAERVSVLEAAPSLAKAGEGDLAASARKQLEA
ncbi:hypothetical protein QU38_02425 [Staphylococcus aureus]|uniref:Uncharacterized protein n=1 Tax=Staphylococcus aureus TaxID=1280 RepID=A0AA40JPH0_STAAU|nr:hypothetical protein QU38_02425 [Staphylococcus aureus]